MTINLCELSTEVLLYIFQFCSICDLCKLRESCKRFHDIISLNKIPSKSYHVVVTNQISNSMRHRCKIILEPYEKWRISHNWKIGKYKAFTLLKQRQNLMPCLALDHQHLCFSHGPFLSIFKRTKNHVIIDRQPHLVIDGKYEDIVKFKVRDNRIIAGQRNGILWIWSLDDHKFIINDGNSHDGDVTCVDCTLEVYVSGSHDQTFKIWSLKEKEPLYVENIGDRIWSLGISPKRQNLAVGSAGFNNIPAFHIYDLERCKPVWLLGGDFVKGSGILDLHWQDENIILTCGYDSCLRQWDVRTGACQRMWEDPYNGALYCLATDDMFTVLTGTNMYGRVVLWDQRQLNFVQMYYTSTGHNRSSPVYCVHFDSTQLFAALDRCVKCLDFSDCRNQVKNYSSTFIRYAKMRT